MISLKEPMVQFTDLLLHSTLCNNCVQKPDDQIIKERSSYEETTHSWSKKSWFRYVNFLYVLNRVNYNESSVTISANVNPKFTQAIILGKDCQWTILTARLTMRSDDKPCLRWLVSPCLVSRSHSFPRNCNRAKKQRFLQSFIFISTITSWDYGYQFFSSLLTCRSFQAETEHILRTKNSKN